MVSEWGSKGKIRVGIASTDLKILKLCYCLNSNTLEINLKSIENYNNPFNNHFCNNFKVSQNSTPLEDIFGGFFFLGKSFVWIVIQGGNEEDGREGKIDIFFLLNIDDMGFIFRGLG